MSNVPDELPWPAERRTLFNLKGDGNLFSPTWCSLKWLKDSWSYDDDRLALEFQRAADKIIDSLGDNDVFRPDVLFIPIAYLYRHSLELKLKSFVKTQIKCRHLNDEEKDEIVKLLGKHDLENLWKCAKRGIEVRWPGADRAPVKNVQGLIKDFHIVDCDGQMLRYSFDKDGKSNAESYPDDIDLLELKRAFGEVYMFLDSCHSGFSSDLEMQSEHMDGP